MAIRRVAFFGYAPSYFDGMEMNIIQWDNSILNAFNNDIDPDDTTERDLYLADDDNYSRIFWKSKLKPNNAWAVPWVTGHTYRVTWANDLDYTQMFI